MRLKSLDVFRGLTVAAMIFVNCPGDLDAIYAPLAHSKWNGCTVADVVFPFFLFIVGVTSHISLAARHARGVPRHEIVAQILRRGAILFALGLFLSAFPFFPLDRLVHLRITGTLQRIGVCYVAGTLLCVDSTVRRQVGIIAVILIGHGLALHALPLDDPEQTLAARVDRFLLAGHLHAGTRTWDRVGAFATLPAVASVMLGALAGRWLRAGADDRRRTRGLVVAGCTGMAAGLGWGKVLPLNESLWSGSFVLFTAGAAAVLLAACMWAVDTKGWERPAWPLVIFGTNPIVAYVGSSMMVTLLYSSIQLRGEDGRAARLHEVLCSRFFGGWLAPRDASAAFALVIVGVWFVILLALHRRRIYLKV